MLTRMHIVWLVCTSILLFVGQPAAAQSQSGFEKWLRDDLRPRAMAEGISTRTFDLAVQNLQLDLNLPGLTGTKDAAQHQAEFTTPARYFNEPIVQTTTRHGKEMARRHAAFLKRTAREYGVPAHILLGIWGRESAFGRAPITHDGISVLATRAYLGPRKAFYHTELIAALGLIESGKMRRRDMKTSWGGALGQPQFMPSNVRKFALDGDGDGRIDLAASAQDSLASIANFLRSHGWTAGRDWGFEVNVPASVACSLEGLDRARPIRDWAKMGISRVNGRAFPAHELAGSGALMMPAGRHGPAFIVTPNFYVLKSYNNSDLYALFVGHLGDRIAYGMPAFKGRWGRDPKLNVQQIKAIQHRLVADGYDVGGVDGLVGFKSRRAIGAWQASHNLAATCYPDRDLLRAMKVK